MKTANKIRKELGIDSMLEVAYYLSKFKGDIIPEELKEKIDKILDNKGQIILYGVPGTGKTWLARNYVKEKTENDDSKYDFITFHQSYSYEDFIEGFRPKTDNNGHITYKVEDGIFKRMCILSILDVLLKKDSCFNFNEVNFYRVALGEKGKKEDNQIFDYCIKNGYICVCYEDTTDYTEYSSNADEIDEKEKNRRINDINNNIDEKGKYVNPAHKSAIKYIVLEMKKGDIVLVFDGGNKIKAIGKIIGDYEYKEKSPFNESKKECHQFRKVEWLWIAKTENEYILTNKNFNGTINKIHSNDIDMELIKKFIVSNLPYEEIRKIVINKLREHKKSKSIFKEEDFQNAPKYYLIIDEINRGNVSNILGELITLLEKDKRLGKDNQIITTLPYSKEPFAVPLNLSVIGTMNTADRSIVLLDIALRRRFGFIEIEPEEDLLTKDNLLNNWKKKCNDENGYNEIEEEINELFNKLGNYEFIKNRLESINKKIVKLKDRDHRIGHSYFLKVKNIEDLKFVWFYEIIPLLEEYFYNDWEGLKEILKDFVKKDSDNESIYRIKRYEEFNDNEFIEALKNLIPKNNNQSSNN